MSTRLLARVVFGAFTAALGACSATNTADEIVEARTEALLVCAAPKIKVCHPGEGVGGATVCACEAAPPPPDACVADPGPLPSVLAGCQPGTILNGGKSRVWTCPLTLPIPAQIFTPSGGNVDYVQEYRALATGQPLPAGMPWCDPYNPPAGNVCYYAASSLASCLAAPAAGSAFIVEWQNGPGGGGGGGCRGPCEIHPAPGH